LNNETTDKLMLDANQDKPRIIYRNSQVLTTIYSSGSYVYNSVRFDLTQIKTTANTLTEVYLKDNQNSRVYTAPLALVNSSNQYSFNANFIMSGEQYVVGGSTVDLQFVDCAVYKRSGSASDTYNIYLVLYSTNINDNLITGVY